jgi:hypothetical protein
MPGPTREPLEVVAGRIARLALLPRQAIGDYPGGPVLSVVRDDVSGEIFVRLNVGLTRRLTELMNQRLLAHIDAVSRGQITVDHDIVPGGHAEVIALNDAIAAREAATGRTVTSQDMATFELHNVWLQDSRQFETAARCEHCSALTAGVRVTRSLYIAENPVSATGPPAQSTSGSFTAKEPAPGGKPPPKGPSSEVEISPGAFESSAGENQAATAGAVAGAAMTINQGQVQNLEDHEHDEAEKAFRRVEPTVKRLVAQGQWVAVTFYFDEPKAPNLLKDVFKEPSDVSHFVSVDVHHGDTKDEALGEQQSTMEVGSWDDYDAPKKPLGKDRTGKVTEVRVFPPDPPGEPVMWGHPSFVGNYRPDSVDQASVSGRFDEMVATGMHRSLRFHAGSAAVPGSVAEMWQLDDHDQQRFEYATEWISGNDPTKGISARFVENLDGKVTYTITSYMLYAPTPLTGGILVERLTGESNSAVDDRWGAVISWKQTDNSD